MKLLLVVLLLVGWTVVAQDKPLTPAEQDALAIPSTGLPSDDTPTLEVVLSSVIAILGILLKVYASWNSKNDTIAQTLIRGIEVAGNSSTVKAAVRALAAEEGNTAIIHKKVQKTIANDAAQESLLPQSDVGTENTTSR